MTPRCRMATERRPLCRGLFFGMPFLVLVIASPETGCASHPDPGGSGPTATRHSALDRAALLQGAVSVAAGQSHSCARLATGGVVCWGDGSGGDLGNGSFAVSTIPVRVTGLSDAVDLAAGLYHTCAVRSTGEVVCWGDGRSGEFGPGISGEVAAPVTVAAVSDAVAVAAGADYTCALRRTGSVVCSELGMSGDLGAVSGLSDAVAVAAGTFTTCALRKTGEVACWGDDTEGQLGNGSTGGSSVLPVAVSGLSDAVAIAVGGEHACAIRATGGVVCWGRGFWGQLGDGTGTDSPVPVAVSGLSDAVAIAAEVEYTCAVRRTGAVACWGVNGADRQLGNGTSISALVPAAVSGLADAVAVACGGGHACAVRATGETVCWGRGSEGQLGNAGTADEATPVTVTAIPDAAAVTGGGDHTCALRATGAVACWGRGTEGQLGDGASGDSLVPVTVSGLADAVAVSAGLHQACALRAGGQVACWGDNSNGTAAVATTHSAVPVAVSGLADAVAVSAALQHACALRATGEVACWGSGVALGNPAVSVSAVPVSVSGLADAVAVVTGWTHTCALRRTGEIACWGEGNIGRLGNGSFADSSVPVAVSGVADAVAIAAGAAHTCAARQTGEVVCWGYNASFQLGDGTNSDSALPVTVPGLTDAVAVAAGLFHTCALRRTGEVACWGLTSEVVLFGVAGAVSATPVTVPGLSDAVAIAAGEHHTCALRKTGALVCWGDSASGQLGDGVSADSDVPVSVLAAVINDHPCSSAADCGSGFCVDGVCCDTACGGGDQTDCQACSVAAGGKVDGTCTASTATYVCQQAQGTCDVDVTCDGSTTACPDDPFKPAGTPCGTSIGPCDVPAQCTGAAPDCPANGVAPATTQCYFSTPADPCKADRFCTGSTNSCPSPDVPAADCLAANPGTEVPFTFGPEGGADAGTPDGGASDGTVTLTFYDITSPGEVALVETDDVGPAPSPGFEVLGFQGLHHYWEFKTNAVYNGPPGHPELAIKICIRYPQSWIANGTPEDQLYIEHWDSSGVGLKISGAPDTTDNIVCGSTPSLSPFALVAPLPSSLPILTVPAPIVVAATGAAGAAVSYVASATDPQDGPLTPACSSVSGSTFPIGTTTVTCTATDSLGIFARASFTITVRDAASWKGVPTTPVVVYATGTAGTTATYTTPTATDGGGGVLPVTCTPASGSSFRPGKTTVTCTAGNAGSTIFTVWAQFRAPGDGTFFLQPINPDGSSIFKQGSTIPVKFKLLGVSAGITSLAAHVLVAKVSSSVTGTYVEAVSTASGDSGNTFRYDPSGDQYVFNLSTKSMTIGTWSLRGDLGDGVDHSVTFSLK